MTNRQILVAGVIASLAIAGRASAETKSWAALKNKLPADAIGVVSIDVKAFRATPSFKEVMAGLWAIRDFRKPKDVIDGVKAVCGIDVVASISDVAIAITPSDRNIVAAIGLDGIDEAKIVDCVQKIAGTQAKDAKITSKAAGAGKEYTLSAGGSSEQVYAAWPAKDVFVVSAKIDKSTGLDAYAAGKAAAGDLATFIGKAGAVAAPLVWIAGVEPRQKDGMKGGYGALTLAKGSLVVTGRAVAVDAAAQKKVYAEAQKDWQKSTDRAPPELQKVMKALKMGAAGNDITLDVSLPEAELPKLLPVFLKAM